MAKHSISEAARLSGVSRSHLYKKFIDTGKISVGTDKDGKPEIDTAEILRVFGSLQQNTATAVSESQELTPKICGINTGLDVEVQLLREQLASVQDDKKWLQNKVDQLSAQLDTTTRLLEHKAAPEPPKKRWWPFS